MRKTLISPRSVEQEAGPFQDARWAFRRQRFAARSRHEGRRRCPRSPTAPKSPRSWTRSSGARSVRPATSCRWSTTSCGGWPRRGSPTSGRGRRSSPPHWSTRRTSDWSGRPRPALARPGPLLRRRRRGHAPHPRQPRPRQGDPRRPGALRRLDIDDFPADVDSRPDLSLALDEALSELERHDETAAQLVKLRYFAGMSHQEAADSLGIGQRAADRLWALARAWLFQRLRRALTRIFPFSACRWRPILALEWKSLVPPGAEPWPNGTPSSTTSSCGHRGRLTRRRSAVVDGSCGADSALRRKVEALLAAHDQAGTFLDAPHLGSPAPGPGRAATPRPWPRTMPGDPRDRQRPPTRTPIRTPLPPYTRTTPDRGEN